MTHYHHGKIKLPPHSIHSQSLNIIDFIFFLTMNCSRKLRPTDQKEPNWILPGTVQGQWVRKNGCWEGYKSTLPALLLNNLYLYLTPSFCVCWLCPFSPLSSVKLRKTLGPSNKLPCCIPFLPFLIPQMFFLEK